MDLPGRQLGPALPPMAMITTSVGSSTPICKPAKTLPRTPSFTGFVGQMRFISGFQIDSELYQLHGMLDVDVVERTTPEQAELYSTFPYTYVVRFITFLLQIVTQS